AFGIFYIFFPESSLLLSSAFADPNPIFCQNRYKKSNRKHKHTNIQTKKIKKNFFGVLFSIVFAFMFMESHNSAILTKMDTNTTGYNKHTRGHFLSGF